MSVLEHMNSVQNIRAEHMAHRAATLLVCPSELVGRKLNKEHNTTEALEPTELPGVSVSRE